MRPSEPATKDSPKIWVGLHDGRARALSSSRSAALTRSVLLTNSRPFRADLCCGVLRERGGSLFWRAGGTGRNGPWPSTSISQEGAKGLGKHLNLVESLTIFFLAQGTKTGRLCSSSFSKQNSVLRRQQ
jgi:hypothetical protein